MNQKINPLRVIFQLILVLFVFPLLPILIAWRWQWWEAWVVATAFLLAFILSRFFAARKHPGILVERSNSMVNKEVKPWDRVLSPLMAFGTVFILLVTGLEERFNWTPQPFPTELKIAGILILVLGYAFASWALIENAFFSGTVRIQKERGHVVCDTGPYRWVRHPGYAGNVWSFLVTPIILDSGWGFIVAGLLLGITILRTALEDRTLQQELPGYADYAKRVKYRLFPGLW